MLKISCRYLKDLYELKPRFVSISTAIIVLLFDFITGIHIRFPALFVLPVGLAAWHQEKTLAYVLSIVLPLARVWFLSVWQTEHFLPSLINAPVTMIVLWYYSYLICRVAAQKKSLERRVRVLEGILPICASCKQIRNEKGEYERIEKYICEHSEASFSHTICPECGKKLYPEHYPK